MGPSVPSPQTGVDDVERDCSGPRHQRSAAAGDPEFAFALEGSRPGRDLDPVADAAHERNATLNYRGVLARELTAKDARLYLQARQYRRSRRPTPEDEAPDSV
jgi:hypothetical protein